jgi:putative ABC transport system permease protein
VKDVLYLAWRYLAYNRGKTAVLVASIMLVIYLPVTLRVLVAKSAAELTARAESTPLVVGAKGSALEMVLNALYFESAAPEATTYAQLLRIQESGLARAIPLAAGFHARGHPIIGTSLGYFEFRKLRFQEGRAMAVLGECVVGATLARSLGLVPGDSLVSSPESVFDLAGVYPLKMRVSGVLARSFTPDDLAIFVDLKTAWVIDGRVHGHQDLSRPEAAAGVLSRDQDGIVANASVVEYTEITPDNIESFHFHGDLSGYPISAIIVAPDSDKSQAILMGRYQGPDETQQIVRPTAVMDELLDTILTVQSFVVAGMLVAGLAALGTAVLVFLLSLRIRRREIETMAKIGAGASRISAILASEILAVLTTSVMLAGLLTALTSRFSSEMIRALITS